MNFFDEFRDEIQHFKGGQNVNISVIRNGDTLSNTVAVSPEGIVGIYPQNPSEYFNLKEKSYSLIQAIPAGTAKAFDEVANYLKQLRLLFSKEVKAYEPLEVLSLSDQYFHQPGTGGLFGVLPLFFPSCLLF